MMKPMTDMQPRLVPQTSQGPGKSAQSVGHMAKAAIAAAHEAGIDVPKNAQGFAASQIAKGADPAAIFAAQVVDEPTVPLDDVVPVGDVQENAVADTVVGQGPSLDATGVSPVAADYAAAAPAIAPEAMDDAETALALLT